MIRPYSAVLHIRTVQFGGLGINRAHGSHGHKRGFVLLTAAARKVYSGMGLSASSRQKAPAAAKTSETGCQKEDETRSHREHVCSGSYLAGTEHARSSGTRSTRLYQEMRRGGAGQRHSGTLRRPAHLLGILFQTICCLAASLTQEQPKMCDKVQQPNNLP